MTASNISSIALGVNEVRDGAALTSSGVAHIAEGIIAAWGKSMRWSDGEGDNLLEGFFTLADMYKEVRRADGSEFKGAVAAKYRAIATEFGVDGEFSSGDKIQFKRAWQIAAAERLGADVEFDTVQVERRGKEIDLRVIKAPAGLVLDLYKEDGTPTEAGKTLEADMRRVFARTGEQATPEAIAEACKADMVPCNGGKLGNIKLPSITDTSNRLAAFAIKAGLMPEKLNRNRNKTGNDEGRQFSESLAFVHKSLDLILDPESEESNFAPSPAIDESLHRLQAKLTAYFAAMQTDLEF